LHHAIGGNEAETPAALICTVIDSAHRRTIVVHTKKRKSAARGDANGH